MAEFEDKMKIGSVKELGKSDAGQASADLSKTQSMGAIEGGNAIASAELEASRATNADMALSQGLLDGSLSLSEAKRILIQEVLGQQMQGSINGAELEKLSADLEDLLGQDPGLDALLNPQKS